jgi:cell fate regulator YaaT (PSP1 superfamily)
MHFVEIEFRGRRRITYVNPEQYPLTAKTAVVVQADRGIDLGYVNLAEERFEELNQTNVEEGVEPEAVLRLAQPEDFEKLAENVEFEQEARSFYREEVKRLTLEMKLVEVECQLDRRKLTFYFTADGRVDFRELVKSLAQKFHTRIDLRQIGARDESKRLGGIGICGRELCCSSWIREFKPVTTSMMKDQHMILNPQKNTGPCGKLRCCLRFEVDQYRELNLLFPKMGMSVKGPRGRGRVAKFSYNWEHIGVEWEDGAKFSYGLEHLAECTDWKSEESATIQSITFSKDPSIEQERKEIKEGELVARATPRENGEPKVSVRSIPKKGAAKKGTCDNCGKDKSAQSKHQGGSTSNIVMLEPSRAPSDGKDGEDSPGQQKSRRGGSRRRGRGRGDQGKGDQKRTVQEQKGGDRHSGKQRAQQKPAAATPATGQTADTSGEGTKSEQKKPNRRQGNRGRGGRSGGGNKPQGGKTENRQPRNNQPAEKKSGNVDAQQTKPQGEKPPRQPSGGEPKQGSSSQPNDTKPKGRPPRPRGRNRRR